MLSLVLRWQELIALLQQFDVNANHKIEFNEFDAFQSALARSAAAASSSSSSSAAHHPVGAPASPLSSVDKDIRAAFDAFKDGAQFRC